MGKRETLLRLLTVKFGPLTEAVTSSVESIESTDELNALLERVLTATSLEEMKEKLRADGSARKCPPRPDEVV